MSAPSYFERRLKEVVETIERLRAEGHSWEELYPLEVERRALEWIISAYCASKNIISRSGDGEESEGEGK